MAKVINPVSFAGINPLLTKLPVTRSAVRPSLPVTNPDFDYVPSRATNVQSTWRKFGWIPPRAKGGHE